MCFVRNSKNEFRNFPSSEGLGVCQLKNSFIFLNFIDINKKELTMNNGLKNPIGMAYYNRGCKSRGTSGFKYKKVPAERYKNIQHSKFPEP